MRKMLLTLLAVCVVTLLPTLSMPVYATKPILVEGYFDYVFEITDMRPADGNLFIYATEDEYWKGSFEGTAKSVFRVEMFSSGFWNVWLRSTFTGTVNGESGTLVIQLVGKRPMEPEPGNWHGQWVIISGTGDLANLHGQGTWWGPGYEGPEIPGERPDIYYGQIHFD